MPADDRWDLTRRLKGNIKVDFIYIIGKCIGFIWLPIQVSGGLHCTVSSLGL